MGKKKGKKKKEPDLLALQAEFTEKLLNAAFRVEEEKAIELVQELLTNEMPKIVEIAAKQDQVLDVPQMLNNRNHHGRTPLQFAAVRAHLEVIAMLLTAGAGVDVPCLFGQTPVHLAAFQGADDVVQVLIDAKANVAAEDGSRETALHIAACQGHGSVANRLIAAGKASGRLVDVQNRDGRTALHLAVLNGNANVAEALVKGGADVRLEDADKVRADDLAERMAQPGIETMIRTHAMVKSCQERIRELQAEQRGPHFMDRNYVVLPPLADAPPEAVRAGSVHSEAPVVSGITI